MGFYIFMIRQPVDSSNIQSIGYDSDSQTLEIEFHSGEIYQYFNVPSSLFEKILAANSQGEFFHQFIKNNYTYEKII